MRGYLNSLILVLFFSIAFLSCSDKNRLEGDGDALADADVGDSEDEEGDVPEEDTGEEPLPCLEDGDCDDNDPCNGNQTCDEVLHVCTGGSLLPDGTVCSMDPRMICLAGECGESACGDGFVDPGEGEFCEPPGEDDCDAGCLLVCGSDLDCLNDGEPCNGLEYCNADTSRCSRRDLLPDGTLCVQEPRKICLAASCVESICGDGFLDAAGGEFCEPPGEGPCNGDCTLPCSGDPDCVDDGMVCNGDEYCDLDTTRCSRRNVPPPGTICRPAVGECDEAELCTGITPDCPADAPKPEGSACDDGNPETAMDMCDGEGLCRGILLVDCELTSVSCGVYFSCAVTPSGETLCWGRNDYYGPVPIPVGGLPSGTAAVTGGHSHACALLDSGGVKCWGSNMYGQLGDGSGLNSTTAVDVVGLPSACESVDAGDHHSCVVTDTGAALCWGRNNYGQLGSAAGDFSPTPVEVDGMASGVAVISAGAEHTCAVTEAGAAFCWGRNNFGRLGDGTQSRRDSPVQVVGLTSGVASIAAGDPFTCALIDTGDVKCWGRNDRGQLGDGTTTGSLVPVDVSGLSSEADALSAHTSHACALMSSGGLRPRWAIT